MKSSAKIRQKRALKQCEKLLVKSGVNTCCARLLALGDKEGSDSVSAACPVCQTPLEIKVFNANPERAGKIVAEIGSYALAAGLLCKHLPPIAAHDAATESEDCPCGKPRMALRYELRDDSPAEVNDGRL